MLLGSLLVLLVLVCIALGAVILLQRSEGGALGMGGGPSGFMTARGAGDLLTRTTAVLAAIFFGLCLLLTVLSGRMHSGGSVVDRLKIDNMNPDALNHAMRPARPATAPAAAGGDSAANIGVVTPAPGAPAPGAPSSGASFEAPRPEVHTAPAVRPTTPPTAADSGASRRSSSLLGVQTAPQSTPTVAPLARPFPTGGALSAPAPAAPAPAASGNTSGGQ
ncbi:preprotein translocase subunit SecG [Caulobacter sp. S45]|uniref:preprotein translocase subunit SecG n=1 Tax=Caulobacter sp. S45 TaxID=1641861 RepID=UPI0015775731|nr:preprotein translocase subunit SecG [Caulobacter sp. S45]